MRGGAFCQAGADARADVTGNPLRAESKAAAAFCEEARPPLTRNGPSLVRYPRAFDHLPAGVLHGVFLILLLPFSSRVIRIA